MFSKKGIQAGLWKVLGILCIIVGLAGIFLPIIPGILLIFLGVTLLGFIKLRHTKKKQK